MILIKDDIYEYEVDGSHRLTITLEFDGMDEAESYLEGLKQNIAIENYVNENFSIEEFDAKVKELLREVGYEIEGVEFLT